jgi:hypothetical protein
MGVLHFLRHEPLVFFIVIGSVLFAADTLIEHQRKPEILIDSSIRSAILSQEEALKGSPLTLEEQTTAIQHYIDNKILFDDAIRLGLDKDRNFQTLIVRKYKALLSTAIAEPTPDELKQYHQQHQKNYMSPRRYDLEEYFFPVDSQDYTEATDKHFTLHDREAWLEQKGNATQLDAQSQQELLMRMGKEISEQLISAEMGQWNGPLTNYRGAFFVRIVKVHESEPMPYEDVERYLRDAWIRQQQELIIQSKIAELQSGYRIELIEE